MVKIFLNGCCGRMGKTIAAMCKTSDDFRVVAGCDVITSDELGFPVFTNPNECDVEFDAIIDFSNAAAIDGLLGYCAQKKLPVVVCTTGLSEEQNGLLKSTSEVTAVLKSANMSLGINLLEALLAQAAPKLAAAGFDIEIVEKHHNKKVDAPSGTALALADACNGALSEPYEYVYDRSSRREKRPVKEIGISAVRGGSIVGDHDVIFAGQDEVITFSHRAYSRAVFGKGAVEAARFLAGKEAGFYTMSDVLG